MRNIGLILKMKWRLMTRLLRDNLFDVFVLAPIILCGAFLALGPPVERFLRGLASHPLWGLWGPNHILLAFLAVKLLLSWRRVIEAIEPQTSPDACLVSLPIRKTERCIVVFLIRCLNNSAFLLGLKMLLSLPEGGGFGFFWLFRMAMLASAVEVGAGLLRMEALPLVSQALAYRRHSPPASRRGVVEAIGVLLRRAPQSFLPEGLRALVVRDVLLTLRFFSFGVILHFIGALLCVAVMVNLLPEIRDDARAVEVVTGLASAYGVALLALLTPRLLKFQLPYWWMERSSSIPPGYIWRAKVWHANLISMAFPLLVVSTRLWMLPAPLGQACLVLVEQMLTGILVASFAGALIFETHQQPWLSALFSGLGATAFALMMVLGHWAIFFLIFPYLMSKFEERGESRIRFLLLSHDPN
ncbi:MAG: hypothetical protein L0387_03845 [Acidobacteria bacterium]|nr:hypothetical protein [Acidobacteriota bacterium]MCI0620794.1 hypothetical protein [Acidobacteriota bacterium]MCI0722394.1 hypothetical protein [Acidobacteriota bacterium]